MNKSMLFIFTFSLLINKLSALADMRRAGATADRNAVYAADMYSFLSLENMDIYSYENTSEDDTFPGKDEIENQEHLILLGWKLNNYSSLPVCITKSNLIRKVV